MDLDEGEPRLFARDAVRKDTTRAYLEQEEEELRAQLTDPVGEEALGEQLGESTRENRKRRKANVEDVEPRRSARLAKKRVTLGGTGLVDNPEDLPYYMEAVESGYAGPGQSDPAVLRGKENEATADLGGLQESVEEEDMEDPEEAMDQSAGGYEELELGPED